MHFSGACGPSDLSGGGGATTAENVFERNPFPVAWPFEARDFARADERSDSVFYAPARFVHHIDEGARAALTAYYVSALPAGSDVLDLCSSWVSHLPAGLKLGRVVGLGMNAAELAANAQLSEFVVRDLNADAALPFADASFDAVTCVVSVDYLARPREVFAEIRRVLRPGGRALFSQSNRCFPSKAIDMWLRTSDMEHLFIIGCYFHFAAGGGGFGAPRARDISPREAAAPGRRLGDPIFVVEAEKVR